MNIAQNPPPIFSGEFCHALDPKNRVTIPAKWRSSEADEFYVRADSSGRFLRVMPPEQFRAVGDKLNANPSVSPKERAEFLRRFYSGSQQVVADKQGRMLVPEELGKALGLAGEAVLVGAFETFEIWNPETWEATKRAGEENYERVAELIGL
jgi:MraZ protein